MQTIIAVSIFLVSLAGIVTSATLLWVKVVRPFVKFCKRVGKLVDSIHDLPEWCASVEETLLELKSNGGGSIKDKVTNIEGLIGQHVEDPRCHAEQHRPLNDEVV